MLGMQGGQMLACMEDRCWHAGKQMLGMQGGQGMVCMVEDRDAVHAGRQEMLHSVHAGRTGDA